MLSSFVVFAATLDVDVARHIIKALDDQWIVRSLCKIYNDDTKQILSVRNSKNADPSHTPINLAKTNLSGVFYFRVHFTDSNTIPSETELRASILRWMYFIASMTEDDFANRTCTKPCLIGFNRDATTLCSAALLFIDDLQRMVVVIHDTTTELTSISKWQHKVYDTRSYWVAQTASLDQLAVIAIEHDDHLSFTPFIDALFGQELSVDEDFYSQLGFRANFAPTFGSTLPTSGSALPAPSEPEGSEKFPYSFIVDALSEADLTFVQELRELLIFYEKCLGSGFPPLGYRVYDWSFVRNRLLTFDPTLLPEYSHGQKYKENLSMLVRNIDQMQNSSNIDTATCDDICDQLDEIISAWNHGLYIVGEKNSIRCFELSELWSDVCARLLLHQPFSIECGTMTQTIKLVEYGSPHFVCQMSSLFPESRDFIADSIPQ